VSTPIPGDVSPGDREAARLMLGRVADRCEKLGAALGPNHPGDQHLTGAPGVATAAGHAGLLICNRALLDDGRDFGAAAVLPILAVTGSPTTETEAQPR
jgi:hypothetical protein